MYRVYDNLYNFSRYTLYSFSNFLTEMADSIFRGMNAIINQSKSIRTDDNALGGDSYKFGTQNK